MIVYILHDTIETEAVIVLFNITYTTLNFICFVLATMLVYFFISCKEI